MFNLCEYFVLCVPGVNVHSSSGVDLGSHMRGGKMSGYKMWNFDDCHSSKRLDALIGKTVEITFKDGKTERGVLAYPHFGIGYLLKSFGDMDTRFMKSHVKSIREIR